MINFQNYVCSYPGSNPECCGLVGACIVDGKFTKFLLDPEQLVVLRCTIRTARRSGLDLSGIHGDRQICDEGILGLAGTMRDHCVIA